MIKRYFYFFSDSAFKKIKILQEASLEHHPTTVSCPTPARRRHRTTFTQVRPDQKQPTLKILIKQSFYPGKRWDLWRITDNFAFPSEKTNHFIPRLDCDHKSFRRKIFEFKKTGLGFLVEQIYLVSLGNYDPHAEIWCFSGFFYLPSSIGLHFKTAGPFRKMCDQHF